MHALEAKGLIFAQKDQIVATVVVEAMCTPGSGAVMYSCKKKKFDEYQNPDNDNIGKGLFKWVQKRHCKLNYHLKELRGVALSPCLLHELLHCDHNS